MAVFVDFFHFLLLLVTFFTGCKFCKLLFITERGKVCYFLLLFLLLITLINYFLLGQEGQGLHCIHCATGERVHLDFSPFFLLLRGRGMEVNVFFSLDI